MDRGQSKTWLWGILLSLASLLVICGCGVALFVSSLTPPPDGPTDIPIGSTLKFIGEKYPGRYDASVSEGLRSAMDLSPAQRKVFSGEISLYDKSNLSTLTKVPVLAGMVTNGAGSAISLDAFLKQQKPNLTTMITSDDTDFKLNLPEESYKLKDFDGSISMMTADDLFILQFTLKHGVLTKSWRSATLAWD